MIKRLFKGKTTAGSPNESVGSEVYSEQRSFTQVSSPGDLDLDINDTPGEDSDTVEMSDDTINHSQFESGDSAERLQLGVDSNSPNQRKQKGRARFSNQAKASTTPTTFVGEVPVFSLDLKPSLAKKNRRKQRDFRKSRPIALNAGHRRRGSHYCPEEYTIRPALPSPGPGVYDIQSDFKAAAPSPNSCTWGATPRTWTPEGSANPGPGCYDITPSAASVSLAKESGHLATLGTSRFSADAEERFNWLKEKEAGVAAQISNQGLMAR
jgi:hypothetical protein